MNQQSQVPFPLIPLWLDALFCYKINQHRTRGGRAEIFRQIKIKYVSSWLVLPRSKRQQQKKTRRWQSEQGGYTGGVQTATAQHVAAWLCPSAAPPPCPRAQGDAWGAALGPVQAGQQEGADALPSCLHSWDSVDGGLGLRLHQDFSELYCDL